MTPAENEQERLRYILQTVNRTQKLCESIKRLYVALLKSQMVYTWLTPYVKACVECKILFPYMAYMPHIQCLLYLL
jgi:hypothetical protein